MVRHDIRRIPGLIISPRLIRPHDFPPWPNFPRRYKPLRLEHHSVVFLLSSIAAIVTAQAEPATATSLILPSSTSVVNASDILSYPISMQQICSNETYPTCYTKECACEPTWRAKTAACEKLTCSQADYNSKSPSFQPLLVLERRLPSLLGRD